LTAGSAFGPKNLTWTYKANPPISFFSGEISGAQRLPNGDTLICAGVNGTLFEVTARGETVWKYVNPVVKTGPLGWSDPIPPDPNKQGQYLNEVFRVQRYAPDYPGLVGRDLTPGDPIERNGSNNQAPNTPNRPVGTLSGKSGTEYSYEAMTTDPDGDQIYYWFDWGDNTSSGWLGPYESGTKGSASHVWSEKGNYEIKVKAKDSKGAESGWSDPLPIIMPTIKQLSFIERLSDIFPLFHRMLNLINAKLKMIYLE
jgi:hypothetical protein